MNFFGKNHRIFVIPPLALVLGVISFLSLNLIFLNWVETRGKDWLESTLTQKTGLPVSVGDINTSFPGLITLRDVEINNPSFLVLEKIDVRFFPWVLFHPDSRGMNFLHFAVQSSKLDLPSLPKDKSKQANKSQPVLPPFPISGKIKNFTVLSDKGEIPVSLSGDFHVGRKGGGGDFVLQSVLFKEGTASLKFNSSSQWETAAAVHGARFDQLSSYLPETLKSIEGAADFNLTASGTGFDFEDSGNVWGLEVHGARFRAELADGSLTPWLSGKAHLGQDKANVDLASQDGLTAKGEIKDPLSKKPLFLVNLEGNQVSFSSLQKSFPFLKFAPFEGVVDLRAKVEGELNDIAVSGQTTADLSRGKVKLPPVEANFSFQNGSFALDARSGKTQFILSGKKVPNGLLTYQSSLKNLELKKIGRLNDWANVNGKFDATFSGQWDPSRKPEFEGSFFLGDLKWGRKKSAEFIEGDFGFQKGHLWFDTENGALALKAEIEPDLIAIEKFKVQFQTNSYISAYGQVHLDDGTSSLNIKGQSIPPDLWPPLVHYYPEIEGSLDIEGTVNRNQKETFGKLTLLFHEIRFISEGHTWNGGGDFLWDQKGFQFKNTRIDGGYQGEVSWVNSTPEPVWGADVILDRADPDLLFELFHETKTVGGALTGQAQFTAQGSQFVGVSSLTWVNPLWGGVRADKLSITLENEGGKIKIPSGEIIRGESAVRLTGEIDRKSPAEIVFNLMIQAQQAGTGLVKFDGGAEFLGRLNPRSQDFEAKLRSDIIWINGYPFSNVDFKLENEKGIFKITGKDDENLSADLKYDSHHGYIKGTVKTGTLSVETLFSSILKPFQFKDNPVGEVSADLDFRGSVQSPLIQAKLLFPQLEWRQEKLNAQAFVVVEGTTVTLVSSRAELDSGGVLFAKGTLNAEKEGEINVDGVGSDIPLDSLFNFLKWPARWEGVTNASFEIKGPNKDRVFSIVFDGEHNGFGPFSNGGALSGTALGRGGEWDLGGITVNSGPGFVRLKKGSKVFVQKNQGGNMRLVADTRNLQLGALTLFGPLEVTGSWEGQSEVEESKKEPMEFDVFARSLWINQYVLNGNITRLRLKDKEVTFFPIPGSEQQISGILDYHEFPVFKMKDFSFIEDGVEKLFIDGQVAGPEWDFDIRARDLDARVAQGLLDLQAPMTGNMELRGTVKGAPSNPFIKGVVIWKKGSLFEIPVDFATAKVQVENGIVDVDRLLARKNDGYVLKGAVRFGTSLTEESSSFPPEISLRVENGDLRVLKEIFPSVYYSKGDFDGVFSLSGQGDNRTVSGFLNGEDLRFKSTSYIPSLKKGRVQVELSQDRLVVKEARARLHNGNAQLTGDILFEKGLPEEFNLNLFTTTDRGISIRVPDLAIPPGPFLGKFSLLKKKLAGVSRGEPKLNLFLKGSYESPRVEGKIELDNTVFTYPPAPSKPGEEKKMPQWYAQFINRTEWDVLFTAGNRTRYENELVTARVNGSMHLSGQADELVVNGRILSDQGSIVYSGNEFKIDESVLEIFAEKKNLVGNEEQETFVYLKVLAEKDVYYTNALGDSVKDTIIMEVDRAPLGQIQPRFRSVNNPNLSSEKAFRLALGLPLSHGVEEGDLLAQDNANSEQRENDRLLRAGLVQLLDSSFASPLARAIARQTGLVDFIRVTYQEEDSISEGVRTSGADAAEAENVNDNKTLRYVKGTKVKMGRELAGRLFADYSFRFDEYENNVDLRHELELAYKVHKNLFIRAISELDSERTLGRPPDRRALLENRWRFGLPRKKEKNDSGDSPQTSRPSSTSPSSARRDQESAEKEKSY